MLIPREFLRAVVKITTFRATHPLVQGTGFVLDHWGGADAPRRERYLITCRHVLHSSTGSSNSIDPDSALIETTTLAESTHLEFRIQLTDVGGAPIWYTHPKLDADVAILPIAASPQLLLAGKRLEGFDDRREVARLADISRFGILEGELVHVLGFPGHLFQHDGVIVRTGAIALMEEALQRQVSYFLIDATVFGGNSGGPVVYRPSGIGLRGGAYADRAYLIGVVSASSQDPAATNRPLITFSENTGISHVIPLDYVYEVIDQIPAGRSVSRARALSATRRPSAVVAKGRAK